jgi:tRNA 2-selenouridine synthase
MSLVLRAVGDLAALGFDDIIDVRSPSEFAEDHLPGAINLPVLDDAERARVGTIYKQVSPFDARRIGAALVAGNAARHLTGPLADRPGGWRPLIYCWRGGQRSSAFTTILQQVGWRAARVEGGYKSWRRLVVEAVAAPVAAPLVVLDGNTGTAKTEILRHCALAGHQVIDLEGLANHRGSLFGARDGGQPGQKAFEGRLALALAALDPARPVLVEAESSRIGAVSVPRGLWKAMCVAPRLHLALPVEERARYLVRAYGDLAADAGRLETTILRLRPMHAAQVIGRWIGLAHAGEVTQLAQELMQQHYDPRYEKHRARHDDGAGVRIVADSLAADALAELAARVAAAAGRLVRP